MLPQPLSEICPHPLWEVLYCACGVTLGEYCMACGLTERYHNRCLCGTIVRGGGERVELDCRYTFKDHAGNAALLPKAQRARLPEEVGMGNESSALCNSASLAYQPGVSHVAHRRRHPRTVSMDCDRWYDLPNIGLIYGPGYFEAKKCQYTPRGDCSDCGEPVSSCLACEEDLPHLCLGRWPHGKAKVPSPDRPPSPAEVCEHPQWEPYWCMCGVHYFQCTRCGYNDFYYDKCACTKDPYQEPYYVHNPGGGWGSSMLWEMTCACGAFYGYGEYREGEGKRRHYSTWPCTCHTEPADYLKRTPPRIRQGETSKDRKRRLEEVGMGSEASDLYNKASQPPALPPTPPRVKAQGNNTATTPAPNSNVTPALSPTPPRHQTRGRTTPTANTQPTLHLSPQQGLHTTSVALSPSPLRPSRSRPKHDPSGMTKAQRSPQPTTAAAARAAATLSDADSFAGGMRGSDALSMRALVVRTKQYILDGIPKGTLSSENWGFKWAVRFCEAHTLPVLPPKVVGPEHAHKWDMFPALMITWVLPHMKPSARTVAKGHDMAKPPSALNAAYGWRRVVEDAGRYVPNFRTSAKLLRGLIEEQKERFGDCAMAVTNHIPFPLDSLRRMCDALIKHQMGAAGWSVALTDAIAAVFTFSLARGPRLNEWIQAHIRDTFYRRLNFVWCDGHTIIGSTAHAMIYFIVLGYIPNGTLLRVQNVPMKTDRTGLKFTGRYMWYKLDRTNPLNFAAQWARYEILHPCPEDQRAKWAAFSPDGGPTPFKEQPARRALHELMLKTEGTAFASEHYWHDFRATIASALTGDNQSPAAAQALVCWASVASVQLYGQLGMNQMADLANISTTVDAARHAHLPRPHVNPEDVILDLDACATALESEGKRKAPVNEPLISSLATPSSKARKAATSASNTAASTTRKHTDNAAGPSAEIPTPEYDIGPPFGHVTVDNTHALANTDVTIRNVQWGHGLTGSTACTIVGYATANSVYVVEHNSTGLHYPFTKAALKQDLKQKYKKLA